MQESTLAPSDANYANNVYQSKHELRQVGIFVVASCLSFRFFRTIIAYDTFHRFAPVKICVNASFSSIIFFPRSKQ